MSTPIGLGVPVPKMLRRFTASFQTLSNAQSAIVGTFTFPFALYQLFLSGRVSKERINNKKMVGDKSSDTPSTEGVDPLLLACRSHANFVEYVPLAFVLAAVAELNGAGKRGLTYMLTALLAFRVMHVELGMRANQTGDALGRLVGHLGTQVRIQARRNLLFTDAK